VATTRLCLAYYGLIPRTWKPGTFRRRSLCQCPSPNMW